MKHFLILFFLMATNIRANTLTSVKINDEINSILKRHHFKEKNLGIVIAKEGKPIFELNSDKQFIPASLTKIITAGAVLTHFPMNSKFTTEVWASGKVEKKKLMGDICLKGGGDPSFVSEKMWFLVNELTREEFNQIEGDLILDASKFDDEIFDSGRESVRVDRAFDAPISALSFNWNSANIFVRSNDKAGEPAKIFVDPKNKYIEIENKAKTGKEGSRKTIEIVRGKSGDHDKILVTGSIPLDSLEIVSYKSITNPILWTGNHFIEFLSEKGISFHGKIKIAKCQENFKKIGSVNSKNLNEIISDMLKFSNNFVAEMLGKNLSASLHPEKEAKMKEAIEAIQNYLQDVGIKKSDYILENISGLTRDNKFTANQILQVLYSLKNNFQVFPEFLAALPIAGVDGTLKNRIKNKSKLIENEDVSVRAKTGYLDGVVGLAGFVGRKQNSPLVFTFMFNGDYEQGLLARALFDEIIEKAKKWE